MINGANAVRGRKRRTDPPSWPSNGEGPASPLLESEPLRPAGPRSCAYAAGCKDSTRRREPPWTEGFDAPHMVSVPPCGAAVSGLMPRRRTSARIARFLSTAIRGTGRWLLARPGKLALLAVIAVYALTVESWGQRAAGAILALFVLVWDEIGVRLISGRRLDLLLVDRDTRRLPLARMRAGLCSVREPVDEDSSSVAAGVEDAPVRCHGKVPDGGPGCFARMRANLLPRRCSGTPPRCFLHR